MPQLPDNLREFDDVPKMRKLIYDNALEGLRTRFPASDGMHRLELADVRYSGPQEFTMAQQKRALMTGRSLHTPITGKWRLVDEPTGNVLEEKEDVVMQVPYMTQRGTFIVNGNDYTIVNQSRMKPGVYTRTKTSGDHEAQFNVRPGTAPPFRVWMEPATGIFRVNVGQANIPMYPLFKALGTDDEALRKAWGDEIYDVNVKKTDKAAVDKAYAKFAGYKANKDASHEEKVAALREFIGKAELDPWVTGRTLGIEATNVTPEVLLRTTGKLLNINRGEERVDDRDAPQFSNVLGVEDFVRERIDKDAGKTVRNLLWKIRRDRSLKRVGRNALGPYMRSLLLDSGLAQPLEETNPMHIADQLGRIVKFGEGGIGSTEAVTDSARDVNPGQVGFIDLVAGPESTGVGVDVRAALHTYKGSDRQVYAEFLDKAGQTKYLKPEDMEGKVLAFPAQEDDKEVYALKDGEMIKVPQDEVDYFVPSFGDMNTATVNMTPMATGFMPTREFYAAKYWSQLMPLAKGEVPLVQPLMPDGATTYNEHYGRKYAGLPSIAGGIVTKVTTDGITITGEDGKKHIVELAKDFPFNRLTAITYEPLVQEGDVVKPGDTVAFSNFNDRNTGAFNMGVNLKTAVVPYRGKSFEDSYVISETASRKLATQRLIGVDKDQGRGVKINRNKFISAFPGKYTTDQLDKLDEFGVVKSGAELKKGDPVILAIGPKLLSAEDAQLGNLHKVLRNAFRDESVTWDANDPGVVTDAALTARGAKVNVRSVGNVQVGDKLVNQFSNKGVVGEIVPDEEMPMDVATGDRYEMLFNPMTVLSRMAPNQLLELQLAKIAKRTGTSYRLPQTPPKEGWARFTENELAKAGLPDAVPVYDPKTGRTLPDVTEGYSYVSAFHHLAEKKLCLTDDTEVLTADGWKPILKVKADDRVLTRDPYLLAEEWQHPIAIRTYDVDDEELIRVRDDDQDLLGTIDHQFYFLHYRVNGRQVENVRIPGTVLVDMAPAASLV